MANTTVKNFPSKTFDTWFMIDACPILAHSLAHGAGRRYGRQALHTAGAKFNKSALTTTALGSEVVCLDSDLLIEERPEAYKNVQCVVEDMEADNICQGVVVFRPIVTYKVREGRQ